MKSDRTIVAAQDERNNNMLRFLKDFSVGCGTLTLFGVLVILLAVLFFVIVPLIFFGIRIAFWLAVPFVALIVMILLVALLGRLVTVARKHW